MRNNLQTSIVIGIILLFLISNFSVVALKQASQMKNLDDFLSDDCDIYNVGKLSGWPQVFDGGSDDQAWGIDVDSQGNVIVTGYSVDKSVGRSNMFTIKYDNNGNELWNVSFDSGMDDFGFDVTVDSGDNVIVFGFSGVSDNWNGSFVVVKYNRDGVEQWHRTYRNGVSSFAGGIATDSNDNIIITGCIGDINQKNISGWTVKISSDGSEKWNNIFRESWADLSLGVTVDQEGNIIVVGASVIPVVGGGISAVKYDEDGNVLWWKTYGGNEAWDVAVDSKGNIVIIGDSYSYEGNYVNWYVIKCDNNGSFLWDQEYDSGEDDSAMGVAVDSQDSIIVSGYSSFSRYQKYEHCLIVYDKDGTEVCLKRSGVKGFLMDAAVNHNDKVFVTGSETQFFMGNSDYYTDVYDDLTPPSANIIKPISGYLYLFNKQLLSIPDNTIVIGRITISVDVEDISDVEKVEFYVDNRLMETISESPFEWTWSDIDFGKHTIKTMTYDSSGSVKREEIKVTKIF